MDAAGRLSDNTGVRTALSLLVIAFSTVALGAGYWSGISSMAPAREISAPRLVDLRAPVAVTFARSLRGAHSFAPGDDLQSPVDEDAVVTRARAVGSLRDDASIALVVEHAGRSLQLESGFLSLPVPLTVAIDPAGDDAIAVATAAHNDGKNVYAEFAMTATLTPVQIRGAVAQLRERIPFVSGLAVRFEDEHQTAQLSRLVPILRAENLRLLDLSGLGAAAQRAASAAGLGARSRDLTADNRDEPAYVNFMLDQAVTLARGRGSVVVIFHPRPQSLSALAGLFERSERNGVQFTSL